MSALREARVRRGWSQGQLIHHLRAAARDGGRQLPADGTLRSMVFRWEAGQHEPSATYRQLFSAVYSAESPPASAQQLAVRSHQFIPTWIGSAAAQRTIAQHDMKPEPNEWSTPSRVEIDAPEGEGTCTLYVWPHGVAVLHVVEELSLSCLAALALWRRTSYRARLQWAGTQLAPTAPEATAAYVLSLYWLNAPIWSGKDLDTALRVMCMPRVLLSHETDDVNGDDALHAQAKLAEDALLAAGWDHPGVRPFGVAGTSAGYASWSGVVYHAQEPSRALSEEELVAYELGIQSMWAYCAHLNDEIENQRDPVVPDEWGWRYLRAMRCRLGNPRPQEPGQHRSMRDAILETSQLPGHLAQAIDTLREMDR